jgi:anti-sigma factor RsiW
MSCNEVRPILIGYHFATVDPDERGLVERHLPTCSACVIELVELKRAIELDETGAGPSPGARDRLRRAIAEDLRGPAPRHRWRDRSLALAFAGSAVLASLFAMQAMTAAPGSPPVTMPITDHR